jgi:hypothetical protein
VFREIIAVCRENLTKRTKTQRDTEMIAQVAHRVTADLTLQKLTFLLQVGQGSVHAEHR